MFNNSNIVHTNRSLPFSPRSASIPDYFQGTSSTRYAQCVIRIAVLERIIKKTIDESFFLNVYS